MSWLLLLSCADPCAWRWGQGREDCRFEEVKAAWVSQDTKRIRLSLEALGSPLEQDLARVRLAVIYPRQAGRLCAEVREDVAVQKCRQILGRPHLQGGSGH